MKTLILYKSKHGATKQYAEWIREGIPESQMHEINTFDPRNLPDYDNIIIGGRTYMGSIHIAGYIEKYWHYLRDKNVTLYTVGVIAADDSKSQHAYKKIPTYIRNSIDFVKLPGRIIFSEHNTVEKMIIVKVQGSHTQEGAFNRSGIEPIVVANT